MHDNEAITEAEALARYPELQFVVTIREAGWNFQAHTIDGELALVGFYNWPAFIDAVWVFDRNRCIGLRMADDAPGMRGGTVWKSEGRLDEVINELLTLPPPGERHAPTLILPATASSVLWTP